MLTRRENLFRIFRHEMPEWIPVCGHVDPYNQPSREGMDPNLAAAMGTVRWSDESTVFFSRYLGMDVMDYMSAPVRRNRKRVSVEYRQEGEDAIEVWHTPAGELRQARRRCREDGTSYIVEHLVKGAADLPALAAVFADEELQADPDALEAIRKRRELVGDDGILMCFMPGTPLGMMYRVYSGVEALAYLCADAPQALRDLFSVMERNYQEQFRIAVSAAADAFVTMDDTSTTTISPRMFEEHSVPCTDQRAAVCHRAGKLYFHHSCGLIRDLLPLYRRTRMDAVHAFTVPPIGNVTVAEGRRALAPYRIGAGLGDRITIIASMGGAMAEVAWDPERMRVWVRQIFQDAHPEDHFILGLPAYPHRTMAETRAVREECRRYQRRMP